MIKEVVSRNVAILAQEKGFNEKCIAVHYANSYKNPALMAVVYGDCIDINFKNKDEIDLSKYVLAPLRSSLNAWLTDKHNITVYVIDDIVYGHESDYGDTHYYIKNRHKILRPKNDFMTYNDALDFGLMEALKLI